jgi:hypothetical protein
MILTLCAHSVDGKLEFIKEPRPDHVTTSRRSFKRRHKVLREARGEEREKTFVFKSSSS